MIFDRGGDPRTPNLAKFPLGRTVATPGALDVIKRGGVNPSELLARHQRGDYGDLDAEDIQANEDALRNDERILSVYHVGDENSFVIEKLYVLTEWDRSLTTVLLASEY